MGTGLFLVGKKQNVDKVLVTYIHQFQGQVYSRQILIIDFTQPFSRNVPNIVIHMQIMALTLDN